MIKIKWFKGILVQKIPLLVIAISLTIGLSLPLVLLQQQTPTLPFLLGDSSPAISALMSLDNAFADHGQEVTLTLYNSSFGSLTSGGGNQVSVFASYRLNDNSIAGQTINAVMEVYAPNGTLIRTSSYPEGFVAQSSGGVEGLETTIRDPTLQSVTANVTFRNADKTEALSNNLRVNLNVGEEGTTAPTTGEEIGVEEESPALEPESEQVLSPQQPDQEGDECEPSYPGVCIPSYPPDLDCDDISYNSFRVLPPDPHGLDSEGDGIGCETNSSNGDNDEGGDGAGQDEENGEDGEDEGEGQELPLPLFGVPRGG